MSELSHDVLEAMLDAVPAAVVLFDRTGTVHAASRAARELVDQLAIGASVREVLEVDPEAVTLQTALPSLTVQELDSPAQGMRLIALQPSQRALSDLTRYIAMLGHELRNPLAPLRLAAEHLRSSDADIEQTTAIIERQVAQMARLVDDLLDTARLARGQLTLSRAPLRILDVVESALQMTRPGLDAQGHALEVEVQELGTVELEGDAARLSQALANILANATQYTPSGGNIELRGWVDDLDRVHLQVEDNGQGIETSVLETIFDAFAQPQRATSPSAGLGLGLGLAREIARLHGGTLVASSQGLGLGARFELTLPGARVVRPITSPVVRPVMSVRTVLIVDDNEDAADMLGIVLGSQGVDCTVVHTGDAALEEIASRRFDVAIVDIGLPDVDGLEVARRVSGSDSRPVRLVGLSGYGQPSDYEAATAAGFDAYFVKPLAPDAIDQLLG